TESGTSLVKDFEPGTFTRFGPMQNSNGTLYFLALPDSTGEFQVWKSDGTTNGTVLVATRSESTVGNPPGSTEANRLVFFTPFMDDTGTELWRTDGTDAGTYMVTDLYPGRLGSNPRNLTECNGTLYFEAETPQQGIELWRSDGTAAGTVLV